MNNQCVVCGGECLEEEHVCKTCRENHYNSENYVDQGRFAQNGGCMSIAIGIILIFFFVILTTIGIVAVKGFWDFILSLTCGVVYGRI